MVIQQVKLAEQKSNLNKDEMVNMIRHGASHILQCLTLQTSQKAAAMLRPGLGRLITGLWARAAQARARCCSSQTSSYAQYSVFLHHLNRVESVGDVVRDIRGWLEEVGATGRVYFNSQGVNCQMCLESDKLEMFKEVMGNKLGVEQDGPYQEVREWE